MTGMVRRLVGVLAVTAALAVLGGQGVARATCTGDCDENGEVSMIELLTGLAIELGNPVVDGCEIGAVDNLLLAINNAADQCGTNVRAQACRDDGGTFSVRNCCASAPDFPDRCAIGACGCPPSGSVPTWVCNCGGDLCFNGEGCVPRGPI